VLIKVVNQIQTLRSGSFLGRQENVLVFGNPGSGKTHLVSALGQELVRNGHRVYFAHCNLLVQELLRGELIIDVDPPTGEPADFSVRPRRPRNLRRPLRQRGGSPLRIPLPSWSISPPYPRKSRPFWQVSGCCPELTWWIWALLSINRKGKYNAATMVVLLLLGGKLRCILNAVWELPTREGPKRIPRLGPLD
jgi:IstB-like ATP binding protein